MTTTTDTEVQNLVVNKLTYSQWKTAKANSELSATEAYELTDVDTALQEKLSQGTGITIANNTVTNAGVREIATGTTNGTISVNTDGTSADVAVKGLGSAAYTNSDAYDAAGTATAAINALDSTKSQTAGADGLALSITQTDGKITSISGSIAANTYDAYGAASTAKSDIEGKLDDGATGYDIDAKSVKVQGTDVLTAHQTITTGSANGTISVAGSDVAVKGLGSAAYVDTTTSVTASDGKALTSGGAYTNLVRRLSSSAATGSTSQGVYVDANGQVQTCDAVTSTYSGTGTAPVNGTAVKSAIDAAIASVYKPAGSVAFANLPSPVKALNGNVYDVTDAFTTDSKFVNSGESYPAGTNVVVINTSGTTYKYDVLPGFIDLTPYQLSETAVTHTKNTAAGSSTTPVYVATDGTATAIGYTIETSVPSGAVFTDTKNTAGSTDTSSKLFLIGATSQAANPQTYSQDTAFVDANGRLNSAAPASDANDTTVATTKWVKDQSYVPTTRTINSKALSSDITLLASDVSAVAANTAITAATKCKITYDSKGLVTAGADLEASDIPDISATYQTKITSTNKLPASNVSGLATVATTGKSSDLTNDAGFISGITSSDVTTALGYTPYSNANPSGYQANVIETVKVNGTALTPSSKAVDVTVPTETTVSGWGFTKNTGTVTSVNNTSPVNGNVTLSIPTVTDTYSATSSDGMSGKAVASAVSGKQDSSTAVTHTASTAVGSATNPVYIASDGTATATTYTLSKSVPSDAVFTDTTYSAFTGATSEAAGTSGLVPAPAVADRAKFLAGDGTWATPSGTTYSDMTGATESAAGTHGLAPAPAAGDNTKFLRGDATWATVDSLPSQTSQSGKFLTTNGTTASWANVPSEIPSQSGNSGKYLTTNGTAVSWATVNALPSQTSQSGKFLTTNGSTASWASLPTVDQTYSGTSTNAQSGVAVKSAIDTAISSVYKAAGSIAFASRPTPGASYEGNVYNITDAFTTDSTFVEGAGVSYPAGTNIVCINTSGTTYKWDVLAGFVDLSGYQPLLVSGTNIKTVNGTSVLGSGNISVDSLPSQTGNSGKYLTTNGTTASWGDTVEATESSLKTINSQSILGTGDITIDGLPSQSGQSGKYLTTNGSAASWAAAPTPATDSSTINTNASSQLQAIGVIEKNAGAVKYDWVGTLAQWNAGRSNSTIPDSWICYITDDETTSVSVDWSSLVNVPTAVAALATSGGNLDAGTM